MFNASSKAFEIGERGAGKQTRGGKQFLIVANKIHAAQTVGVEQSERFVERDNRNAQRAGNALLTDGF